MISPNLAYLVARKKDGSDVATGMKFGVVSFSSWSKSICNLETGIMRIRGTSMTTASFRRWTPWMDTDKPTDIVLPQGQASRFAHGWLMCLLHPDTPTMIGWIIYGRVQWKSSARKVTHPSTFLALGGLTSEFPWDLGQDLEFEPPF